MNSTKWEKQMLLTISPSVFLLMTARSEEQLTLNKLEEAGGQKIPLHSFGYQQKPQQLYSKSEHESISTINRKADAHGTMQPFPNINFASITLEQAELQLFAQDTMKCCRCRQIDLI